MRARLILGWVVVLTMVAAIGYAQAPPAPAAVAAAQAAQGPSAVQLSLAQALDIARRNNPDYLTFVNNRSPAASQSFYSAMALFTPSVSISAGQSWTQAGVYNLQGLQFATPKTSSSGWNLDFNYALSGTTIANRGVAAAQLRAADQDIAGAATVLKTSVETEYINLLEARAQADLAQHVVARAQELLNLAQAQYNVGQKTIIDVKQAQVTKGNADVSLLQAQQNVQIEVLKLYRLLGVPAPEPPNVVPTDTFAVVLPEYNRDSLVGMALDANPAVRALRAREGVARWNSRAAYSTYLPALSLSAQYGKFTQTTTENVLDTTVSPPVSRLMTATTNGTNPWNVRLGVSLPLYDAFQRNSQLSQARANESNAVLAVRARELQVRSDVGAAYLTLMTAYQTIGVQSNNRAAAEDALTLAEEQYKVGSGSIIQLNDAQVAAEQAGVSYINAVYDYHKAIAALELAVGRPLR